MSSSTATDERAFERLIGPHRSALQAHCYRMLGSAADAEDALQETLLRAWRGLPGFDGRSSLRSWLYRVATNVCLRAMERRPRRVLPIDYTEPADPAAAVDPPVTEDIWIDPYPSAEQRESVELAFVAALQHLPPRQRAVLLLRDVLGFAPSEIAAMLDASPASVYSMLQRAHRTVDERLPARSQQQTLRDIGDARLQRIVERYVQAWDEGDVDAIVAMLTDDVTFSMPPQPSWYRGPEAVRAFLATLPCAQPAKWRYVRVAANGQVGLASYARDSGEAHAIEVMTLAPDGRIAAVVSFQTPEAFARFGLPERSPA